MNLAPVFHVTVIFFFVSLLSHFWLIHFLSPTPTLSTKGKPLSSYMCSITPETANVCSSYSHMRGPGIGCWFSDRSNCSHSSFKDTVLPIYPNISLTSDSLSSYTSLLLYWSLYNCAAYAADILTPTTAVQGVDIHSWGLYCRRCYCICVCWGRSSRIFHFSHWLGQLSSVLTKDESPHTGNTFLYPHWVVL